MDLPVIGAHCALSSCNELDLLPIQCLCKNVYCRKHISPDSHNCTSQLSVVHSGTFERSERCSFTQCNKPSLSSLGPDLADVENSAQCAGCLLSFCATHRFPSAHSCPGTEDDQPNDRYDEARKLLRKNFAVLKPAPSVSKPRTVTTKDPKKLAQIRKVELMKMRQKAQPGDPKTATSSIAMADRHYLLAKYDDPNTESFSPFWFVKSISMGRAFDLLQNRLGVVNTSGYECTLFKLSPDSTERVPVTSFDITVSEALEAGSQVVITRVSKS